MSLKFHDGKNTDLFGYTNGLAWNAPGLINMLNQHNTEERIREILTNAPPGAMWCTHGKFPVNFQDIINNNSEDDVLLIVKGIHGMGSELHITGAYGNYLYHFNLVPQNDGYVVHSVTSGQQDYIDPFGWNTADRRGKAKRYGQRPANRRIRTSHYVSNASVKRFHK